MCRATEEGTGAGVLAPTRCVRSWQQNLPRSPKFPTGFRSRCLRLRVKSGRPDRRLYYLAETRFKLESGLPQCRSGILAQHPPAHAPTRLPAILILPAASAAAWPRTVGALPFGCARRATSRTFPVRLDSSCPVRRGQNTSVIARVRRRVPPPARRVPENAGRRETAPFLPPRNGTELRSHNAGALPVATHPDPWHRLAAPAPVARRVPGRYGVDAKAGSGSGRAAWTYYPPLLNPPACSTMNSCPWPPAALLPIPPARQR